MTRSHFTYTMSSDPLIIIFDETRSAGGTTVTNDIENVVKYIAHRENIDAEHKVWIYRDSDAHFDGYDPITDQIYTLGRRPVDRLADAISSQEVLTRLKALQ